MRKDRKLNPNRFIMPLMPVKSMGNKILHYGERKKNVFALSWIYQLPWWSKDYGLSHEISAAWCAFAIGAQIDPCTNTSCCNKEDSTLWNMRLQFHISYEISYMCVSTTNIIWHDINWRYILKIATHSGSSFNAIYVRCILFKLILTL